jgi:HlyD family secretion protein
MMIKSEEDKIELRSEEFQEVLGTVPSWILRWGITVLAMVVVILLIGSAVIKYPDTLSSQVVLTGLTPPAEIVAHASGKLKELHVNDNQEIKKGAYLAIIDNYARTEDVLFLKKQLADLIDPIHLDLMPPSQLQLGNLQSLYASLYLTFFEYKQFNEIGYNLRKIEFTKERITQNEKHYQSMLRQRKLVTEQYAISETQYKRDSTLTKHGVFSQKDLEDVYNLFLQSRLSLENVNTSLENLLMQIDQLQETLYDIEFQYQDKKNTLETQLKTQVSQLNAEIEAWEMTYVLNSPIDGHITFTEYWVENQNVSAGDVVFDVVPLDHGELIGKAMLPVAGSGKVEPGQKVHIRLQNFPENEYGVLLGTVQHISLVPARSGETGYYSVEIALANKLVTTYKKELPYLSDMQGHADIITEDLSLLERLILPIKKILKTNI